MAGKGSVGRRGHHWSSSTETLTAHSYINVNLHQQQPCGVIYQHDNVRLHSATKVRNLHGANNIKMLLWPVCLPDISPIKHLILWNVPNYQLDQPTRTVSGASKKMVIYPT